MEPTSNNADIGVVVGGDGVFSWFGRTESVPLLFVGVKSSSQTGSRAYLAATLFDELPEALASLTAGRYRVKDSRRLEVLRNGRSLGSVFTDAYLQRGAESNCIRYTVEVSGAGEEHEEVGIGDGVVVTTAAGSTGYYSYPDKIQGERLDPARHASLREDQVGVCHIVPTYTSRSGTGEHPLRYAVPWGSRVDISISRRADARLYGVGPERGGVKFEMGDLVSLIPSMKTTKVVVL